MFRSMIAFGALLMSVFIALFGTTKLLVNDPPPVVEAKTDLTNALNREKEFEFDSRIYVLGEPSGPLTFRSWADTPNAEDRKLRGLNSKKVDKNYWPSTIDTKTCTASLVGPRILLTAAHCIDRHDPGDTAPATMNWFGEDIAVSCTRNLLYSRENWKDDHALCRLDKNASLPPESQIELRYDNIDLSDRSGVKGERVSITGYGCGSIEPPVKTTFQSSSGMTWESWHVDFQSRERTIPPILRIGQTRSTSWDRRGVLLVEGDQSEPGLCPGDSGGPLFAGNLPLTPSSTDRKLIIGVNSFVGAGPIVQEGAEPLGRLRITSGFAPLGTPSFKAFLQDWLEPDDQICLYGDDEVEAGYARPPACARAQESLALYALGQQNLSGNIDTANPNLADLADEEEIDFGAPFGGRPSNQADESEDDLPDDIQTKEIQSHILAAVEKLAEERQNLGYHISAVHTEDLAYGDETIKATRGDDTMCVAAVSEVLLRAVESWSKQHTTQQVYDQLTASDWMSGRRTALRPWLYRWGGERIIPAYNRPDSTGAYDAFVLFGIGKPVLFPQMEAGDIIYFNRTETGHAAVFLGFLGEDFAELETYSDEVIGFRYFSAQSKTNPGLGYRHAYFAGQCPDKAAASERGILRDCGVIKKEQDPIFLSGGRLHSPDAWRTEDAAVYVEKFYSGATIETLAEERYSKKRSIPNTRRILRAYETFSGIEEPNPAFDFSGETTD